MVLTGATPDMAYIDGLEAVLRDETLDPAYRALMMGTPSQSELAQVLADRGHVPDPDAIWQAAETLAQVKAERWTDLLPRLAAEAEVTAPYSADAEQSARRALGAAVPAAVRTASAATRRRGTVPS